MPVEGLSRYIVAFGGRYIPSDAGPLAFDGVVARVDEGSAATYIHTVAASHSVADAHTKVVRAAYL